MSPEAFWARVERSQGCWIWRGAVGRSGYGNVNTGGRTVGAHRFAYSETIGVIPTGMVIRHRCDTKLCVNPTHLEVGTQADNVRDAAERGQLPRGDRHPLSANPLLAARGARHGSKTRPDRVARGARHGCAKLTEVDVREIRECVAGGASQTATARAFGISQPHVSAIVARSTWAHVS